MRCSIFSISICCKILLIHFFVRKYFRARRFFVLCLVLQQKLVLSLFAPCSVQSIDICSLHLVKLHFVQNAIPYIFLRFCFCSKQTEISYLQYCSAYVTSCRSAPAAGLCHVTTNKSATSCLTGRPLPADVSTVMVPVCGSSFNNKQNNVIFLSLPPN
jgi:hypothetical protein